MSTPLSDAISALVAGQTPESWNHFFETLLASQLGVVAHGVPAGATGMVQAQKDQISLGRTQAYGMTLLLTCADFDVFRRRFPQQGFNAELTAAAAFKCVLHDPACEGLLVNSAASAHSIPVTRARIVQLASV